MARGLGYAAEAERRKRVFARVARGINIKDGDPAMRAVIGIWLSFLVK